MKPDFQKLPPALIGFGLNSSFAQDMKTGHPTIATAGVDAGAGSESTPVSTGVNLTTGRQSLINAIGSSRAGTGVNRGHLLTYTESLTSSVRRGSPVSGSTTPAYSLSEN